MVVLKVKQSGRIETRLMGSGNQPSLAQREDCINASIQATTGQVEFSHENLGLRLWRLGPI
jgi:hypothetical protein